MDWDVLILALAVLLQLAGLIGCFVPVLPGPVLNFVGLWILDYTRWADFSLSFILIFLILALGAQIIDTVIPVWGTKKYGGSRWGVRGATIGLVIGFLFFPPFGILPGPFLGALIAEYLHSRDWQKAMRSAWGSLMGFLAGTGLKLMVSLLILFYFIRALVL